MNKKEILEKLEKSNLDKNKIIVLSGASLVMQGIISETNDIDLSCDKEYYDKLDWNTKIGAYGTNIKYNDVFEIGTGIYFPNDVVCIEGYKFLNLEKCYEIKKQLVRKKDEILIKKLENILNKKGRN